MSLKYVDLFAGCGGLSLGLERAGFDLVLALEKSEMATETFYHNFVKRIKDDKYWKNYVASASIEEQFEEKLVTKELKELLDNKELMKKLKKEEIDIVVGGPPCQGFSLAGRRNPKDARNILPWQFLEFVEQTNPKAVVIENVVGMSRSFKKHDEEAPFEALQKALRQTGLGYEVQPVHVNAMHFGVPEHRPRLMILGIRSDVAKKRGVKSTNELWRSDFKDKLSSIPIMAPQPTVKEKDVVTIADAISDLSNTNNEKIKSNSFLKEMKNAKAWGLKSLENDLVPNQTERRHQETATRRFRLYQYLRDQGLQSKTLNIPAIYERSEARERLELILKDCKIPAKAPDGTLIAKTKGELIEQIFELKTKKHSQRPLHWNKPSPTVVTLPDDYVHPSEPRIFTVRELARFQSFPDAFEFRAKETTGGGGRRFEVPQYTQVGNAVAPLVAYAVGKTFATLLVEDSDATPKRSRKKTT